MQETKVECSFNKRNENIGTYMNMLMWGHFVIDPFVLLPPSALLSFTSLNTLLTQSLSLSTQSLQHTFSLSQNISLNASRSLYTGTLPFSRHAPTLYTSTLVQTRPQSHGHVRRDETRRRAYSRCPRCGDNIPLQNTYYQDQDQRNFEYELH